MRCCPVLLSLYCIVIVFLNEINGDGDGDNVHNLHRRAWRFGNSGAVYRCQTDLLIIYIFNFRKSLQWKSMHIGLRL